MAYPTRNGRWVEKKRGRSERINRRNRTEQKAVTWQCDAVHRFVQLNIPYCKLLSWCSDQASASNSMNSSALFLVQVSEKDVQEFRTNDFKFEMLKRRLNDPRDYKAIDGYHHIENKLTYILSKLLCEKVCKNYLPKGEVLTFQKSSHGKPYLANHPGLKFNMSNCISQCTASMVANNQNVEVGLDIANVNDHMGEKEIFDYNLYTEILSEEEQVLLSKQLDNKSRIKLFTMIWAVKESYTKLIGLGLTYTNLKNISLFKNESSVDWNKLQYDNIVIDKEIADFRLYWTNNNQNVMCICQRSSDPNSKAEKRLNFPLHINTITLSKLLALETLSLIRSPKFLWKKHKRYISHYMAYLPQQATNYAPNRLAIIFYTLLSMNILGVAFDNQDENIAYIKDLYLDLPEFVGFTPDRKYFPNGTFGISQTFFAVLNLLLLGVEEFDFISVDKLSCHLVGQLKHCDDIREFYMGSCLLFIFDRLDLLGLDYIVSKIKTECFIENYGFINFGKGELHSGYISCFASIYKLLQIKYGYEVDIDKKILMFEWLCKRQIFKTDEPAFPGNGGFNGRENKNVDTCYSFWNLSAMCYFQMTDDMPYNLNEFEKYVFEMQDGMKGGFGKLLACENEETDGEVDSDLFHTFTTLCALGVADGILETTLCLPKHTFQKLLTKRGYIMQG